MNVECKAGQYLIENSFSKKVAKIILICRIQQKKEITKKFAII